MKNKRKILSILLTLAMAVGLLPTFAFAAPGNFPDVPTGEWYYNDVQKAANTGLINGYPDGTFGPNRNMTYAEAVKLAACMHQKHTTGSVTLKNGNPWYQTYVDYAKAHSIISKNYPWESNATRAGYVEIFAHALPDSALEERNTVLNDSIPDVKMSHPQASSIYKLYRAGVLTGNNASGTFLPNNNIRRCEVAAILIRMMDPSVRKEFTLGSLTIDTQPSDITVEEGSPANFRTSVIGGQEPYTFEWHLKKGVTDVPVSDVEDHYGHDLATLVNMRCMADYNNAGYYCIIYDDDGKSVKTRTATLTVTTAPLEIITQPKNTTKLEGEDAVFTVEVTGGKAPYTYQWYFCDADDYIYQRIETTPEYYEHFTIDSNGSKCSLTAKHVNVYIQQTGTRYYCKVTDANGKIVNSATATLTISNPPVTITKQPADYTAQYSKYGYFSVTADYGTPPYEYEWHCIHNGNDETLSDGMVYWHVDHYQLTIANCAPSMDGDLFYCKVYDANGYWVNSKRATLHVIF